MYKSKFSLGDMTLSRVLMIPCQMVLRTHLRNTMSIVMLVSGRGVVDGLEGAI